MNKWKINQKYYIETKDTWSSYVLYDICDIYRIYEHSPWQVWQFNAPLSDPPSDKLSNYGADSSYSISFSGSALSPFGNS